MLRDHESLIILNWGGPSISSSSLVNYMCDGFAALSAIENITINQLKLPLTNAAKEVFSYMLGCRNFTSGNKKSKSWNLF